MLSLDQLAAVRRRDVGFVFQAFNLLPTLDAVENVGLPLRLDGVPQPSARPRIGSAAGGGPTRSRSSSAIPTFRRRNATRGHRSGLGLATAIDPGRRANRQPRQRQRLRVLELLAELNQSRKITIIMATHSREAAAFAARTLYVKDGLLDDHADSQVQPREADENVVS